jgi:putative DNA primase/helicase
VIPLPGRGCCYKRRRRMKTIDAARGRWREILPPLGIPLKFLNGKHQACPACGGRDRVRFDDRRGNGDYFCSHCGAGNGFDLLQKVHGWAFGETARRVDQIIGNLPTVIQPRVEPKKFDSRKALRDLWCTSQPITPGDPVSLYLASRGIETPCADALRYVPAMSHSATRSKYPGMIAIVSDVDGKPATLHRTYLTKEGCKASIEPCRKLMPGDFPRGGAVRLGPPSPAMGVAEGIETALAATALYGISVWSIIAEGFLQSWEPPAVVESVVIFGDNDRNAVGQHAAWALARRLGRERGDLKVVVMIPDRTGDDWNDVLLRRREVEHARAA